METAIVTRFFIADPSRIQADQGKILNYLIFCFACQSVNRVYVAVNPDRDVGGTIEYLHSLSHIVPQGKSLVVIPVRPWGRYVEPLNALTGQAATDGYEAVLSVNTEHVPTDQNISELAVHLDENTLAVGAALSGFHEFRRGKHKMNGMNVPADAFMLLRVQKFMLYGWQAVSEAPWVPCPPELVGTPHDPGMQEAGMKEVPSFSLIQRMLEPEHAQVKLVRVTGAQRDTSSITGDRKKLDDLKRRSAIARVEKQMTLARIPYGTVIHVA